MARWSYKYKASLPDRSYLYVASGGHKDAAGRTRPQSLRHFPVVGRTGAVSATHARNALARIGRSDVPASAKRSSRAKAERLLERVHRAVDGRLARGRRS
jgi:hypothetical protein